MKKIFLLFFTVVSSAFSLELTLEKSLQLAKKNNRELQQKGLSVEQKRLVKNSKIKAGLPSIKAQNTYVDHDSSKNLASSFQNGVYLSQPIFNGGEIYYNAKSAILEKELEENGFFSQENDLVLTVIQNYINCIQLQKSLAIYESSKKEKEQELKKQMEFYKLSLIDKSDVLRIETSLYQTETSILKLKNNITSQKLILKNLLGLNLSEDISLEDVSTLSFNTNDINLEKDIDEAIKNSLLTKKLDKNIEISDANAKANRSTFMPKVNLEYGYESLEDGSFSRANEKWQWTVGVNVTWDIFNFGSGMDTYDEAKIEIEKQRLSKTDNLETLKREIRTAYLDIVTSRETIKTNEKALLTAKETFNIDKEKFNNRLIDSLDFLKTESELRDAEITYLNSELDHYLYYQQYLTLLK